MSVKEAVLAALKELILPELQLIKQEQAEIKVTLGLTNKRLDDMNAHLVDQSRRIDETNKRIDETNKRIDAVQTDLSGRINSVHAELSGRINALHSDLLGRMDEFGKRLDRLYEVIVRREEHQTLTMRVAQLEQDVAAIKQRQAA
jgi:chromosome segregation ATPase